MSFSNSLPGKCHSVNLCSCQLRRPMHKIRKMLLIKRLAFRVSCVRRMYHVDVVLTSTTAANDHDEKATKKNETTKIRKWKTPNDFIHKHRWKAPSSTKQFYAKYFNKCKKKSLRKWIVRVFGWLIFLRQCRCKLLIWNAKCSKSQENRFDERRRRRRKRRKKTYLLWWETSSA